MRRYFVVAFSLLILLGLGGTIAAQADSNSGLITVESANGGSTGVQQTVDQLVSNLEENGLTVMTVVDHGANAAGVELDLPPTQLIIFGNPNLGTQLMNNSQSVAIDLPQKYLVWDDGSGRTFVSYNSVDYLSSRHGLTGPTEVLQRVTGALANFAQSVAPSEPQPAPPAAPTAAPTVLPTPAVLPVTGSASNAAMAPFWVALVFLLGAVSLLLATMLKNRTIRLWGLVGLLLLSGGMMALLGNSQTEAQEGNGLIALDSPYSVDETVSRLEGEITERGLNIMRVIDHAANAASVDRELRPTQVILFGNPRVGTPLMQGGRTIGIDLPQKMLVWEDEAGGVHIAYNSPDYLRSRHNIQGRDEVFTRVSGALSTIAEAAVAADSTDDSADGSALTETGDEGDADQVADMDDSSDTASDAGQVAETDESEADSEQVAEQVDETESDGDAEQVADGDNDVEEAPMVDVSFPENYAEMLAAHNATRTEAGQPAYSWNSELQLAAQNWADTMAASGSIMHDPNLFTVPGQFGTENVSMQMAALSQTQVVNDQTWGWASTAERNAYAASGGCTAPNRADAAGQPCGHYRAIVDAEWSQVGCGVTPGTFAGLAVNFWVCRYK